jgi:hypothetical protein
MEDKTARRLWRPPALSIKYLGNIARSTVYGVTVTFPNSFPKYYQFVGPQRGPGPVVMLSYGGTHERDIFRPGRYGKFGPDWIRNYFSEPRALE